MSARFLLTCTLLFVVAINAHAARYQRTKDGKTLVWNNLRGVAQEASWSGLRDMDGYATGEGTLIWYRLGNELVNSYTGKMVRGKFEGPVIRQQGQTRLQAMFATGEQVSGWSEPGRTARAATTPNPATQEESPPESESEPIESEESAESASPSATPTPSPRSTPRPTATPIPTPIPTPRLTPTASPITRLTPAATRTPAEASVAIPTATPMRVPRSISTPLPILTSTPKVTLSPTPSATAVPVTSPTRIPSATASLTPPRLRSTSTATPAPVLSFAPQPESVFDLSNRSSSSRNVVGGTPLPQAPNQSPAGALPNASAAKNPAVKKRMIADFKQRTAAVLAQMKEATGNFKPLEHLDQVQNLPSSVSANVTYLSVYAQQFRSTVGYETTYYECLDQMETVDALGLAEEATRDLANKDAPAARKTLANFANRTAEPPSEDRKALARYLNSIFFTCEKAKAEAEPHLQKAKTLEAAGKKSEALAEYLETYRIYPNSLSADRIKQLQPK